MTSLRDLNREEWAGKSFLIELRGGGGDGERFHRRTLPLAWMRPEPAVLALDRDPDPLRPMPVAVYRRTGRVADDGAHIYEFEGIE
ncbi:hypothetical protein [Actinomadura nitritigenes]|uniref:hypothetical protein n=1 Tax=Actinomadura nitritigenes TaxID=134602 RepID=UPI003D8ABD3F